MKEVLSAKNVTFAYQDITSGIGPLRQFLKLRDTLELFADAREKHYVGIPTLLVDEDAYRVDGPEHAERLIETLKLSDDAERTL